MIERITTQAAVRILGTTSKRTEMARQCDLVEWWGLEARGLASLASLTLHRSSNVDNASGFEDMLGALDEVARKIPIGSLCIGARNSGGDQRRLGGSFPDSRVETSITAGDNRNDILYQDMRVLAKDMPGSREPEERDGRAVERVVDSVVRIGGGT